MGPIRLFHRLRDSPAGPGRRRPEGRRNDRVATAILRWARTQPASSAAWGFHGCTHRFRRWMARQYKGAIVVDWALAPALPGSAGRRRGWWPAPQQLAVCRPLGIADDGPSHGCARYGCPRRPRNLLQRPWQAPGTGECGWSGGISFTATGEAAIGMDGSRGRADPSKVLLNVLTWGEEIWDTTQVNLEVDPRPSRVTHKPTNHSIRPPVRYDNTHPPP